MTKATQKPDRMNFVGCSRIIMGKDEKALLRLWREKRGEAAVLTARQKAFSAGDRRPQPPLV
jgi:hypothetical protein